MSPSGCCPSARAKLLNTLGAVTLPKVLYVALAAALMLQNSFVKALAQPASGSQLTTVYKSLNDLEKSNFGKSYSEEILPTRLERLEQKLLGGRQSGGVKSRIDNLLLVAPEEATSPQSSSLPAKSEERVRTNFEPSNAFRTIIPKPVPIYSAPQNQLVSPLPIQRYAPATDVQSPPVPSRVGSGGAVQHRSADLQFPTPNTITKPDPSPRMPYSAPPVIPRAQTGDDGAVTQARNSKLLSSALTALQAGNLAAATKDLDSIQGDFLDNAAKLKLMTSFSKLAMASKNDQEMAIECLCRGALIDITSPIALRNFDRDSSALSKMPKFRSIKVKDALNAIRVALESGQKGSYVLERCVLERRAQLACYRPNSWLHYQLGFALECVHDYKQAEREYRIALEMPGAKRKFIEESIDQILERQGKPPQFSSMKSPRSKSTEISRSDDTPKTTTLSSDSNKPQANSSATTLNNEGVRLLNEQKYDEAIQKFEAAVRSFPDYKIAKENLGVAYNNGGLRFQNDPQKAIVYFHKAAYLSPNNQLTAANIAGLIKLMGKDPNDFNVRVQLGDKARMQGDFLGGIVEYSAAIKIKPDALIYKRLGDLYRIRDQNRDALCAYLDSAKISDSASLQVSIGSCCLALKDIPSALAAYQKAIVMDPKDPDVQDALLMGWDSAVLENSSAPDNHIGLGKAYSLKGDRVKAKAEFILAKQLSPQKVNPEADRLLNEIDNSKPVAEPSTSGTSTVQKNTQATVDFGPYLLDLNRRIKRAWFPPRGSEARNAKAIFKVHRSGDMTNLRLTLSTGMAEADQALLKAVENASPFRPLPDNSPQDVDFEFSFGGRSDSALQAGLLSDGKVADVPWQASQSNGQQILLPAAGQKGGTEENTALATYLAEAQRKIKTNWKPQRFDNARVTVVFKVAQNGDITDARIVKSSGSILTDSTALKALASSSPLAVLPVGTVGPITIEFNFDVNNVRGANRYEAKGIVEKVSDYFQTFTSIVRLGRYVDDEGDSVAVQDVAALPTSFEGKSFNTLLRVKVDESGIAGFERLRSSGNAQFDSFCVNAIKNFDCYKPNAPFKTANLVLSFTPTNRGSGPWQLTTAIDKAELNYAFKSDEIVTPAPASSQSILLPELERENFWRKAPVVFLFRGRSGCEPSMEALRVYETFARNNQGARFYHQIDDSQLKELYSEFVPVVYVFVEGRLCHRSVGLDFVSSTELAELLRKANEQEQLNSTLPLEPPSLRPFRYRSYNGSVVLTEYAPFDSSEQKAAFTSYMDDLGRRLLRYWSPTTEASISVKFKISKDGQMTDLRVLNTEDVVDPLFLRDISLAKTAVTNAAPFRPLPGEINNYAEVRYTFKKTPGTRTGGFRSF